MNGRPSPWSSWNRSPRKSGWSRDLSGKRRDGSPRRERRCRSRPFCPIPRIPRRNRPSFVLPMRCRARMVLRLAIAAAERVIEEQRVSGIDVGAGPNGYGSMAESNLDASPPAVLEHFRIERIERPEVEIVLRPLPHGLVMQPNESQRAAWNLTGEQSGSKHRTPGEGGKLAVLHWSARLLSFGLVAAAALLTLIFYSIAFLAFFMPLHLSGRISVALIFGGIGVLATIFTRSRWQSFRGMH